MSNHGPDECRNRALAAERSGDLDRARQIFADGIAAFPDHGALANSAANLAMRIGEFELAERQFAHASSLDPENLEFSLNQAIAFARLDRHLQANAVLRRIENQGRQSAKYCAARGAAERSLGNPGMAADWYARALALDPLHLLALHGRARLAIERGDNAAVQHFDAALAANPGDPNLWLGKAQALDVAGDFAGAREIAQALVDQAPGWTEGLRFLAQLRLGAGDPDFADHYATAARRTPGDPNIPLAWIELLAGNDRFSQAADVAADARIRFPNEEVFALHEAVNCGCAGDDDRAESLFAAMRLDTAVRHLQESRHRIRRGELDLAEGLLGQTLHSERWNVSAHALLGIIWRMIGDARAQDLHGQAGLVRLMPLAGSAETLTEVVPLLHALHDSSPLPLGQSLRGGTQTRGVLFDRMEPELGKLRAALLETIEQYRAGLPEADAAHPLLRHRGRAWQLAGSWSVRLIGGGDFHTSHIHPQGIVSSALYLETPETLDTGSHSGWLEIGRPPPDLRLDLPPLQLIEPQPGHLALFPSTLYHGTRPFPDGQRMTVAFDVTPADQGP